MESPLYLDSGSALFSREVNESIHQLRRELATLHAPSTEARLDERLAAQLRDILAIGDTRLERLERHLPRQPLPVYVVASVMELDLAEVGASLHALYERHDLRDSEALMAIKRRLREIIQAAQQSLSAAEREAALQHVTAIRQMPLLQQAVAYQSAVERLPAADAEWQREEADRRRNVRHAILLGVASLVVLPTLSMIVMFAGGLAAIFRFVFRKSDRYLELEVMRRQLAARVASTGEESRRAIVAQFGQRSSSDYEQLYAKRYDAIIELVYGIG
jgi:hypothetical protein